MIPGPYLIAHATYEDADSDRPTLRTVRSGYDSAAAAVKDLPTIAKDEQVPLDDLVVVRWIEREEAERFVD